LKTRKPQCAIAFRKREIDLQNINQN
jgi:hypothetical protein